MAQVSIKETNGMKIDLREKIDLRKVAVGTIVISTKGFEWELMERYSSIKDDLEILKEAWKDLTTGIIWFDREDKTYTHYEAVEKFGNKIPTIEEWEVAEDHGARDILPNMAHWFWSASLSPPPSYAYGARGLYGYDGNSYDVNRDYDGSVRLVGR